MPSSAHSASDTRASNAPRYRRWLALTRTGTGLVAGLLGLCYWLIYQLLVQQGRILMRLDAIENQPAQRPASVPPSGWGLPIGTMVQDLPLTTLAGGQFAVSDWRGRRLAIPNPWEKLAKADKRLGLVRV